MKWLLILLMCWVLPTAKIQEEEINMAIPSGYRAINEGDVGKQFGTHLDSTIYFDISIHDDTSTFPHVETTSNFEIVGHAGSVADYYSLIQDDDYYAPVASFYEYDIASGIGDWLSYESYNMGGYTITGVTEGSNAVVYVKPLNATFSVTFIENGGSNVDDVDGVTALPNPLPVPTKNGYTFAGWWNSDYSVQYTAGYTIYYNYTLYAKWVADLYDITYNSNGGSAVSSNIGVTAFPSPLPTSTKAGYTFAGWWNYNLTLQYSAGQTINGSLTVYAKWSLNSYGVTYVANGGSPEPDPLTSQATLPTPLPTINKSGYVSGGWYYNSLFTSQALAGDQLVDDVILYAKFTLATYTITYNLDGGTNSVSNPATYNVETATITLLNPSKAGYTFNGWFSDAELTTEATEIVSGTTGNIVLYASFTLSETGYSITYEENGGSPAQTDLTNQNYLPSVLPALTKTNYVFVGWYYDAEFTLPANPSDLLSANVTLYAKFLLVSTPLKGRLEVTLSDSTIVQNSKRFPTGGAVYTGLIAKVDKVEGKSLVLDTEIAHLVALDTQAELDIKFGAKEDIANKGVANGYAPLNASGIVDPIYVPSAYTDYVEYATYANLPASGVEGTLYVVIADETSGGNASTYRWTGSIYVNVTDKLSASEVKALYESNANTNAYTNDEKSKLSGIEPNAEVNILEGIKVEGESDLAITAKKSTIPLATDAISGALDKVDKAYIDNVRNGTQSIPYDNTTSGLDSTTLNGAIDEVDGHVDDIEARTTVLESKLNIVGLDYKEYGVREVVGQSASVFERVTRFGGEIKLGSATGLVANVAIDDADVTNSFDYIPIFKREVVDIDATDLSANVVSNSFVKVQKFYIKEEWVTEGEIEYHYIFMSQFKHDGYRLPLTFQREDGSERDYTYMGAYEASLDGNNKLRSLTGQIPKVSYLRNNFRIAARALDGLGINSKYQITDLAEYVDLVQIPFMIEFATKHSQGVFVGATSMAYSASHTAIADGTAVNFIVVSNATGAAFVLGQTVSIGTSNSNDSIAKDRIVTQIDVDTPNAGETTITFDGAAVNITIGHVIASRAWKTGMTDNVKVSGTHALNDGKHSIVWRGLENPFGNIWKNVDGVKISNWCGYVAENPKDYNDTASVGGVYAEPYLPLGYLNANANNYAQDLGYDANYPYAKFPISVQASSGLYFRDYYYQSTGDRTVFVGGFWNSSSGAGLFYWVLDNVLGTAYFNLGARLSYRP